MPSRDSRSDIHESEALLIELLRITYIKKHCFKPVGCGE